ncbi:hypothetical protein FDUTEX481_02219 [Tolypothrix sp. PCC 7601]|nr:hypothetical protein FDUTEX481_02219 [Tolypothrix sp. PCC 7601]
MVFFPHLPNPQSPIPNPQSPIPNPQSPIPTSLSFAIQPMMRNRCPERSCLS